MTHHKIHIGGGPDSYSVRLDDLEINRLVSGIEFSADAYARPAPPKVVLTVNAIDVDIATDARVQIDEATSNLLISLGWTPPAGDR